MQALVDVVFPVFLVIGAGYLVVWRKLFSDASVDALMAFVQKFAVPCLLFSAISSLDLSDGLDPRLLFSFYAGATISFFVGIAGARVIFKRAWEDSIAIGFCALFSNSVLLGLPITERAYGVSALEYNYMIVALHSPFCYGVGITFMEIAKNRGGAPLVTARAVLKAMFSNALVIGIGLGFVVNLTGLPLPAFLNEGVDLIARAALPTALFGLGGVLYRYRPEGDLRTILFVVSLSLILHPLITITLGTQLGLSLQGLRSATLTAAMAPGINAYVFANMYGVGKRVAASTVLFATSFSIVTSWVWLTILP